MAVRNNNCCRPNPPQEPAVPPLPVAETAAEPVMRRWPHPIAEADTQPEETLLEDIRTLLERRAGR